MAQLHAPVAGVALALQQPRRCGAGGDSKRGVSGASGRRVCHTHSQGPRAAVPLLVCTAAAGCCAAESCSCSGGACGGCCCCCVAHLDVCWQVQRPDADVQHLWQRGPVHALVCGQAAALGHRLCRVDVVGVDAQPLHRRQACSAAAASSRPTIASPCSSVARQARARLTRSFTSPMAAAVLLLPVPKHGAGAAEPDWACRWMCRALCVRGAQAWARPVTAAAQPSQPLWRYHVPLLTCILQSIHSNCKQSPCTTGLIACMH